MDIKNSRPAQPQRVSTLPDANSAVEIKPPKKPKKIVTKLLIALPVIIVLAVGGVFLWYQQQLKPVSGKEIATEFTVQSGEGAVAISDRLEQDELVRSSTAFQFHLRQRGDSSKLRVGTYLLSPSLSAKEVADVLVDGKIAQRLVTIIPGQRLDEIEQQLSSQGFDRELVKEALSSTENPFFPKDNLEGFLAPESYSVDLGAGVSEVIARALTQFQQGIGSEVESSLQTQGLSLREGIILASIVQGETDDADEQKKVAGVFLNRLEQDIALGADPTFRYAAYLEGVPESPSVESPYNTRINKGLPPGPISNFKFAALDAVANPEKTDFLYFVTGDDGKFYYAKDLATHEKNVDEHCIELCKL